MAQDCDPGPELQGQKESLLWCPRSGSREGPEARAQLRHAVGCSLFTYATYWSYLGKEAGDDSQQILKFRVESLTAFCRDRDGPRS